MDEKQAETLLDRHWPAWNGNAEKLEGQFFVHITSSRKGEASAAERATAQEFFGRSKVSFEEAIEDLASKISPSVPLSGGDM